MAKTADELYIERLLTEKGPCCFAAGTKVSTPNGDRTIESFVVWSKPEKGGKPFAAKILATHQRSDQPIYRLQLKNLRADGTAQGETLLVTPSHPFYVPAKRDFVPVIDLQAGDLLQSLADGDSEGTSSQVESLELYLPVGKTYNLTLDVGHTFYVGELKTWVHNTGPCDLPEWPVGAKDLETNLSEVWTLKPTQRGVDIESYLARADYSPQSGWYNVGAERNGYFPLVDFQNGNTLVSLKSVDTTGSTWLGRMQDHIIDLGTNGAKVNGAPATMVLNLRVQPGGSAAAKSLIQFGREYNVKVIVKEFK